MSARDARDPETTRDPSPDVQVVAHRGASSDLPEHTEEAYVRAIEDGADALECGVRLTADGHLVCHHDPAAAIITNRPRQVLGQIGRGPRAPYGPPPERPTGV